MKGVGRRKIVIKKIDEDRARQICFSKRRAGLFKKASELSVLCGVDIAAVAFSPAGKVFSFGSPSVDAVVDRFLFGGIVPFPVGAPAPPEIIRELDAECRELSNQLEAEKTRREELEKGLNKAREERRYWRVAEDLDAFGTQELDKLRTSIKQLKSSLQRRADQLLRCEAGSSPRGLPGPCSSTG